MKATELRIGNTISFDFHKYSGGKKHIEVCSKDIQNIEKGLKGYSPIPLTEEWLLKFGDIKAKCSTNYQGQCDTSYFKWNINLEYGYVYEGDCDAMCNIVSWQPIIYLHQLQNLYFALTGEELTLKL